MRNLILLALFLLCIALLFYPARERGSNEPGSPSPSLTSRDLEKLQQRIEALEIDLNSALLARQQLEQRLDQLELTARSIEPAIQSADGISATSAFESLDPVNEATIEEEAEDPDIRTRLINAGLTSSLVDRIEQNIDENRMARLEWRDRAIREGWQQSTDFSEKMHQLSDPLRGIREEFGDGVYDQYLYASGQPNRVQVRSVLRGSAAELAGVEPGDVLMRYASTQIFSMQALRQATTEGIAGESVLVELQRNGAPTTFTVPRGPLGITMESTRLAPQ